MIEYKKYDSKDLKHVQQVELKVLKEVISICESHNLKYYAYGGTALGAVRHGGFIPWDDDIDIAMFREDYDKLLKILDSELSDEYYVLNLYTHEKYYSTFTKVCLKGTEFKEEGSLPILYKQGIFIDIFPLDNVPKSKIKRKLYFREYDFHYHLLLNSIFKIETPNKISSFIHSVIHNFLNFYPKREGVVKRFMKYMARYNNKTNFVTVHPSRVDFLKFGRNGFFDKRDFEPSKNVKFEDIEINIPYDYDKILTTYYGDYMTIPPKEERFNHAPEMIDFGKY